MLVVRCFRALASVAIATLLVPAAARAQSVGVERFRHGLQLAVSDHAPAGGTVRSPVAPPGVACRTANPSPACLRAAGAVIEVVLRWPAVSGVESYRVEAREERGTLTPWSWLHDIRGTADTVRIRNPSWRPVGVGYAWRVVALVAGAAAVESDPVRLVGAEPEPPAPPAGPRQPDGLTLFPNGGRP